MSRWFVLRSKKIKSVVAVMATFMVFAGIGAVTASNQSSASVKGDSTVQSAKPLGSEESEKPPLEANRTEIETTDEVVPFATSTTYDGTIAKDTTVIRVEGQNGKKIVKTEVKYRNGVEVNRALISESITVPAVTKVVAIGTKIVEKLPKPKPVEEPECPPTATPSENAESQRLVECVPDPVDDEVETDE